MDYLAEIKDESQQKYKRIKIETRPQHVSAFAVLESKSLMNVPVLERYHYFPIII